MINTISPSKGVKNFTRKEKIGGSDAYKDSVEQSVNLISPNAVYSRADISLKKVSFKGWFPTEKNEDKIDQIVDFITAPNVKKIAIIGHYGPDGDAISSISAMAELIKVSTKKNADMFVASAPGPRYDTLSNINEFKIIDKNMSSKEIKEKYGKYDLVISVDTAEASLFDKNIKAGILDNAKYTVKIDHHPLPSNPTPEQYRNYNYADINLTDDSMSSASQLLMQFVEPLEIDSDVIPKSIPNSIAIGLISDSNALLFSKNKSTFEDMALLFEDINYEEMVDRANVLSRAEFEEEKEWLKKVEFSPDGKKAYIVVDHSEQKSPSAMVKTDILNRIRKIAGVELAFFITGDSRQADSSQKPIDNLKNHKFRTIASIRSTNINLNEFIDKYNEGLSENEMIYGGGHDQADILNRIGKTADGEVAFCISGDSSHEKTEQKQIDNPRNHKFRTIASIRSTNINLNELIDKYNEGLSESEMLYGGGHDKARTVKADKSINELKDILIDKLG